MLGSSRKPIPARFKVAGAALAFAVLAAIAYFAWFGFPPDSRPRTASAPRAAGGLSEPVSQEPAPIVATESSRDTAAAPGAPPPREPGTREIVSIQSDALSLTVERPAAGDTRLKAAEPPAAASVSAPQRADVKTYVVVRGDTLWDIAKRHVGDPFRYPELAEFSDIRNPDLIYPGDVVRIEIRDRK